MLTLPIKRKWFDMIASGEKKEEYRELSPYYHARFRHFLAKNQDFLIKLRVGYSRNSPYLTCRAFLKRGIGKKEWGAPDYECYILDLIEIIEVKE